MVDVWQYYEFALNSEYVRVLSMLGFHMVLSKILHNRYGVSEGPEYVLSSEYVTVTQGSVEKGL